MSVHDHDLDEPTLSTWTAATHGPEPIPDWLVTDSSSTDAELGLLRTGKEADVHLVRRTGPDGRRTTLIAAKRYRPAERRMFHRDAGYQEGRRVRSSRKTRAMAQRTEYGRDLLSAQWAAAEFGALATLWPAGAPVPYPVQLSGTEIMLEFIGEKDGRPAPRLARCRPSPSELADLFEQCRAAMRQLARIGYAHGDLSPYNILVHRGRLVLIDLPQVVDLVANPQGREYLRRDCFNVCRWFRARGLSTVEYDYLMDDLLAAAFGRV